MNRTQTFLLTVLTIGLCALPARAQVGLNKLAQSTMNFQLVSISARASAMGEAVYAVSGGAESIFYNPAGMVDTETPFDILVAYTGWIADIKYYASGATWNLGNYGTVGVSALGVDYGVIHATRLSTGAALAVAPQYEDLGEMNNVGAYAIGVSYAKAINTQFAVGGTVRYTGQNLGESLIEGNLRQNNAAKLVFDAGVRYHTGFKSFRFGMALRNFSSQIRREEIDEQLPLTFTIGTAIDLLDVFAPAHSAETGLTLAADYLHSNNYSERLNLGLEYLLMGTVALRGGYQTNRDIASWSLGFGLKVPLESARVEVNYAYSRFQYFDGVNRVSLGIGL